MKPTKYPKGYRTKRELIQAIKYAEANELFFSRDTMKFFGRQTFDVVKRGEVYLFIVYRSRTFRDGSVSNGVARYRINPETLDLTSFSEECYLADLARDHFGAAVRDNSFEQLVAMGRELENPGAA